MKRYALILLFSFTITFFIQANQQNFDSLINVVHNSTEDTVKLNAYVEIATGMRYVYPDSAFYYAKLAEELSIKYENYSKLGEVQNIYGAYYWVKGDMNKAIQSFQLSFGNYKKAGFNHKLGRVLLNIALGYKSLNEIDSVFHYIELSKNVALKYGDTTSYFSAIGLQIPIYTDQGNFKKAIEIGLESLKQAQAANDDLLLFYAYSNLGSTFYKTGDYAKTEKYHLKALEYAQSRGNPMDEAAASTNLGLLYTTTHNYSKALKYYNRTLELNEKLQNPIQFIITSVNMAVLHNNTKQYSSAIEILSEALDKAQAYNAIRFLPNIYLTRAYSYKGLGNLAKTEQNVNNAIKWAHKTNKIKILTDSYQIKTTIDSTRGNYLNALRFKDSAQVYIDSIGNTEVRNRINELNTRYETEKKEHENTILKKNNEAKEILISKQGIVINTSIIIGSLFMFLFIVIAISRKRLKDRNRLILQQSAALEQSLEEIQTLSDFKNDMTQMLVHDLKNPLNALLNLPDLDKLGEKKELLKYASQKMHNLVINILDVNKYEKASFNLSPQDFKIYEVWQSVFYQYDYIIREKNIDVSSDFNKDFKIIADKIVFERVLSNLLSNAINHSRRGGEISFFCERKTESVFSFKLSDTGYGIEQDKLATIFDQYTQGENKVAFSTGIGLAFCKKAIEAHGGKIWIESAENEGTTVQFEIPINKVIEGTLSANQEVTLLKVDRKKLLPFYESLRTIGMNETSNFRRLFLNIETLDITCYEWMKQVKKSFYKTDQSKYFELIDKILKD